MGHRVLLLRRLVDFFFSPRRLSCYSVLRKGAMRAGTFPAIMWHCCSVRMYTNSTTAFSRMEGACNYLKENTTLRVGRLLHVHHLLRGFYFCVLRSDTYHRTFSSHFTFRFPVATANSLTLKENGVESPHKDTECLG